jgi:hypothetical protein
MLVLLYWNKGDKLQLEAVLLFAVEKLRCAELYIWLRRQQCSRSWRRKEEAAVRWM